MVNSARMFALQAHGDQRYGKAPYSVHLDAVAEHLRPYGETAQVIGDLHDVVEDTDVTYAMLQAHFGLFVTECVAIVTDEPGAGRRERKARTYHKMSLVEGDLELALVVKAADRLANLQACTAGGHAQRLQLYTKEHAVFRAAAYRPGLCDTLWDAMDRLLPVGGTQLRV